MQQIIDLIVAFLLIAGGFFGAVGAWGLVRLPDPMTRLHAPTKAATLGVGTVLIASMLWFWSHQHFSWHELLISLFVFITAPVTGLFLAKTIIFLLWSKHDLPSTGEEGVDWATYDGPGRVKQGGAEPPPKGYWVE